MGNVIMKARQIQHGATNVEEALNLLSPQELIEMSKRMDAIEAWKNKVRDSVNTGSNMYVIDNALKVPVKALSLNMLPIQSGSGDPSPENIRPISGRTEVNVVRTGINIWDEETLLGYWNASTGAFVSANNQLCSKNKVIVAPSTEYILISGAINSGVIYLDSSNNVLGSIAATTQKKLIFTTPENCCYLLINFGSNYGATYNNDCGINYPSTEDEYHAYNGPTITPTIQLGQIVYGGTLDVKTGVLTITHVIATFDGSEDEEWFYATGTDYHQYFIGIDGCTASSDSFTNEFQKIDISQRGQKTGLVSYNDLAHRFALVDNELLISDVSAWRTWLASNPVQVCYKLAIPQTVQLTGEELEMLKGYNLITTDADSMDVTALVLGGEA